MRLPRAYLVGSAALILERAGADPEIAAEVAASLVEADLRGHASHGVRLIGLYVERLRSGAVSGTARPRLTFDSGPLIAIDGGLAFGQVVGAFAARRGVEAAKTHGVAAVAVSGSGHFGRNGEWAEIAAARGIASLHFINAPNSPSTIAPPGIREARLTSNPIAMGAPHPDGDIILDFAVAEIAVNAIKLAAERGERLPIPCVFDDRGELTDDPAAFLHSPSRAMPAFGGFKGYGLGVFAEIFAGAIAGGTVNAGRPEGPPVNNMLSFYLDPAAFRPFDAYAEAMRQLAAWLGRPDAGGNEAPVPGDRSRARREKGIGEGVEVDDRTVDAIQAVARSLQIDRPLP